jgi:hypothetical protein
VLEDSAVIDIEVLASNWRPVRLETELQELHNITGVKVSQFHGKPLTLLFDPDLHLQERHMQAHFEQVSQSVTLPVSPRE